MFKKLIAGFIGLVIVIGIASGYLWSNMDSIVRSAIEKYGSEATRTTVRLGSVKLSLQSGAGSMKDLSVGNPSGFSGSKAIYLGAISIQVNTASVTGNGPIIIDSIEVDQPQITYEAAASGESNLQAIERNAKSYAGEDKSASGGRKIIINRLSIRHGRIAISNPLLKDRRLTTELPEINLTNIGKSNGGASSEEVARLLTETVTAAASKAATIDLAKEIGTLKNIPGSVINGISSKGIGKIKNILGGQ